MKVEAISFVGGAVAWTAYTPSAESTYPTPRSRSAATHSCGDSINTLRFPGTSVQDPFIAQLATLCRDSPTGAKWVINPRSSERVGDIVAGVDAKVDQMRGARWELP